MEETVSMIKSCVVINKGGLLLEDLNSNYKELVGDNIPYKKFNFDSLEGFLCSIPEIHISDSRDGKILTIRDPKLAHISSLVSKQKNDVKKKKSSGHLQQKSLVSYKVRPKVSPSSLKASISNSGLKEVKSMVKSCIVTHKGGLCLDDLNRNYRELVGEPIPYKKFNYASLEELVYSIPEINVFESWQGKILTISDPKLAHISNLVAKQKSDAKSKKWPKKAVSKSCVTYPSQSSLISYKNLPEKVSGSSISQNVQPKEVSPSETLKPAALGMNADSSEILKDEMNYTISIMTSLLVINNGLLSLEDMHNNYKDLVGDFIPYKRFNYQSLEEFVSSVSEFQVSQDKCGPVLTLNDPKYHPISWQPAKKPNSRANEKKQPVPKPSSPQKVHLEHSAAHLKKQEKYDTISLIKACLKMNDGGMMMEDLDYYYEELAGEFIPYRKFDYGSLVEFVCDIPEIFISQRRSGYFLTLDDVNVMRKPHNDSYGSTRASFSNTSQRERLSSERCLLRNSFGPESDVRDLMFKNGMLKVTIKNDLCEEQSGESFFQPTDYHVPSGGRLSEDSSNGRFSSSPASWKQQSEELSPFRRITRSLTSKNHLFVEIDNDNVAKPYRKSYSRYDDGLYDEDILCSTS